MVAALQETSFGLTACSGLGYCFSAALPPYLATAATGAIDKFEQEGQQLAAACTANARQLRGLLADVPGAPFTRIWPSTIFPAKIVLALYQAISRRAPVNARSLLADVPGT